MVSKFCFLLLSIAHPEKMPIFNDAMFAICNVCMMQTLHIVAAERELEINFLLQQDSLFKDEVNAETLYVKLSGCEHSK